MHIVSCKVIKIRKNPKTRRLEGLATWLGTWKSNGYLKKSKRFFEINFATFPGEHGNWTSSWSLLPIPEFMTGDKTVSSGQEFQKTGGSEKSSSPSIACQFVGSSFYLRFFIPERFRIDRTLLCSTSWTYLPHGYRRFWVQKYSRWKIQICNSANTLSKNQRTKDPHKQVNRRRILPEYPHEDPASMNYGE